MLMKFLKLRRYFRFTPFDTATAQGREDARYRVALWSALTSFVSKGLAMVTMVLSVGLTVPYLGAERFGVWITVASFAGMLTILDLGVGNALTNHIAERSGQNDHVLLRRAISGGIGSLLIIGGCTSLLLWLLAGALPWDRLMTLGSPALIAEARQAAMLFAVLFGLSLVANGIQRVFSGLQRGFESNLASAIGSIVAAVGVWLCASRQADIPTLLAVTLGSSIGSSFLLLGLLVKRRLLEVRGLLNAIRCEGPILLRTGGLYFVLQIGSMVGVGSDGLIISSTLGAAQVAVYGVTQRLFQFVTQPLAVINAPLWAAYADAHVRGDRAFIRRTFKRSMLATTCLALSGAAVLTVGSEWFLARWTDGKVVVPWIFVLTFAVWTILEAIGNSFAMFLNGNFIVKQQVIVVIVFTTLVFPLKILGVNFLGVLAVPLASVVVYFVVTLGFYGVVFRSEIRSVLAR